MLSYKPLGGWKNITYLFGNPILLYQRSETHPHLPGSPLLLLFPTSQLPGPGYSCKHCNVWGGNIQVTLQCYYRDTSTMHLMNLIQTNRATWIFNVEIHFLLLFLSLLTTTSASQQRRARADNDEREHAKFGNCPLTQPQPKLDPKNSTQRTRFWTQLQKSGQGICQKYFHCNDQSKN